MYFRKEHQVKVIIQTTAVPVEAQVAADLTAVAVLLEVAAHPAAGNSTIKMPARRLAFLNQIKSVLCTAFDLFTTVVRCFFAQSFFDTNQLVVFSNTVRTAHRTSFDLACSSTNSGSAMVASSVSPER